MEKLVNYNVMEKYVIKDHDCELNHHANISELNCEEKNCELN